MANPPSGPGSPSSAPGSKPNPSGAPRPAATGPTPAGRPRQALGGQLKIPGTPSATPPAETKPAATPPKTLPVAKPGGVSGVNLGQAPLPANKPSTTSGARIVPPARQVNSGRLPPGGRSRPGTVGTDREALGLSAMKPSEMIEGLDAAVRKAEAQEKRESDRRKGGGKIDQNAAIHVTESGGRFMRWVMVGGVAAVLLVGGLFAALVFYSNYKPLDPHKGNEMARAWLGDLKFICEKMKRFEDDETVTIDKAKARVTETIDARIKVLEDENQTLKANQRPPNIRSVEEEKEMEKIKEFKDPFGQPFLMQLMEGDKYLQITAKGKFDGKGVPAPIQIELHKRKAEAK